jgi:hypothetical protein
MTTPPDHDRTEPQGQRPSGPRMRASDDDRAATVRVIQDAVVRGLLTPEEASERLAAAWAAVHVRDLPPLTADLPPRPSARTAPGWGVLATMASEQVRSSLQRPGTDRLHPARVAAAIAIALLVVLLFFSLLGAAMVDGGHHHHWQNR